jgi:ATP/maltotriose-dependent transcriptional regulator MalT
MLDDYHLISSATCHHTLGFFIDHLPANVHVVLSTRVDPPLQLARLRARGELTELRIADLGFTGAEAARLFQDAMELDLTPQEVQRLWERTEGWAAGLVLAGLSLRGRADPGPFIASFEAGHRHVVDYLGSEVLAGQPEPLRAFMVRTSVLQRLSASLCDAVLETGDSGELLAELEQANQFLIALDDHRQWYRYHPLFAQLLDLELAEREPELAPVLHRRAAVWFQDAGDVEAALVRAVNTFEDVGRSLRAARRAVAAASQRPSESFWMGAAALGRSLYLAGEAAEAQAVLGDVASHAPAPDQQPFVVVNTMALLSLLAGGDGDDERAMALARQAMDVAEAQGVRYDPLTGVAYIALARATASRGGLAEAEQLLDQGLQVLRNNSYTVQHAQAMVELAGVRHARGDSDGARAAVQEARRLITTFADPGMLGSLLDRTERALGRASRRRPSAAEALTDRELVVLRLLPTPLSQPEIAHELYLSVNTVRTHIQGIYRKLGVGSRREAVATAREHRLL